MIRCVLCRREEPGMRGLLCRRCRQEVDEQEAAWWREQQERRELEARGMELFEGGAGI